MMDVLVEMEMEVDSHAREGKRALRDCRAVQATTTLRNNDSCPTIIILIIPRKCNDNDTLVTRGGPSLEMGMGDGGWEGQVSPDGPCTDANPDAVNALLHPPPWESFNLFESVHLDEI